MDKETDKILEAMMVETENRPGEYSIRTNPIQEAKLRYIMREFGLASVQEVFNEIIFDGFNQAIEKHRHTEAKDALEGKLQTALPYLKSFIEELKNGTGI